MIASCRAWPAAPPQTYPATLGHCSPQWKRLATGLLPQWPREVGKQLHTWLFHTAGQYWAHYCTLICIVLLGFFPSFLHTNRAGTTQMTYFRILKDRLPCNLWSFSWTSSCVAAGSLSKTDARWFYELSWSSHVLTLNFSKSSEILTWNASLWGKSIFKSPLIQIWTREQSRTHDIYNDLRDPI